MRKLPFLPAFFAACAASAAPPPPAPPAAAMTAHLERFHKSAPLPGFSVVVVREGRVLLARGWGVEVAGRPAPMTADSSVGIGSLTKSLTAMAVLQLAERGLVGLDDPVVKHLPWFRTADEEVSRRITVRMLLSNTSGLPSVDGRWFGDLDASEAAMERLARSLSRCRTLREPGASFEYSNEGWTVLGLLVQRLSGEGYADYLQRHVLDPLEMKRSTTQLARFDALGALHGHVSGVRGFFPAPAHYQAATMPAGSMLHASADDLGRYLVALLDGGSFGGRRVLSEQSVRALWTPAISFPGPAVDDGGTGRPMQYALGWMVDEIDGRTVVHHPGGTRTMTSETFLEPATRTGVAILVNADNLDPYRWTPLRALANNLLHLANGRALSDFGVPRRPDPTLDRYDLPSNLRARYEGAYLDAGGGRLDIAERDGRLQATWLFGGLESALELDFKSEAGVVLRNVSMTVRGTFSLSPEGRVTALSVGAGHGVYRRMAEGRADRVWTRSPDGTAAFALPVGWTVRWDAERFEARSGDLRLTGGWTGAPAPATPGAAQHVETVAGRSWREQVWTDTEDGRPVQRMLLRTRAGAREFEIVAQAPEGRLTGVVRDVVNPMLQGARLEAVVAAAPSPR